MIQSKQKNKQKINQLENGLTKLQYRSNLLLKQLFEVQIQLDQLDSRLKELKDNEINSFDQNDNLINIESDNFNGIRNNLINQDINSINNHKDNLVEHYDKLIKYINNNDEIFLNELSNEFKLTIDNLIRIINKLLKEELIEGYLLSDRFIHFTKDQLNSSCKIIKEYCIENYIQLYTESFINLLRLKIKDRNNLKDNNFN